MNNLFMNHGDSLGASIESVTNTDVKLLNVAQRVLHYNFQNVDVYQLFIGYI